MMTRRHFAVAAAASLGSGLVLGKAHAMDPMRFDRPVRLALAQHFDAVARGNADALSAVWAPGAQVQHVARTEKGQETVQSEPAAEAIQRWTKDPDLFAKGKILAVELLAENIAYATVDFTWRSTRHIELFTLLLTNNAWRISNKAYYALATRGAGGATRGGY